MTHVAIPPGRYSTRSCPYCDRDHVPVHAEVFTGYDGLTWWAFNCGHCNKDYVEEPDDGPDPA